MTKSWGLIPRIVDEEKTIESRWYQTKRAPWDTVQEGDTVYFKNSGEAITASANVSRVLQFELKNLKDVETIIAKYDKQICLVNTKPKTWGKVPKYCVLVFLKDARYLKKPLHINKAGFGAGTAWLSLENVDTIKI